MACKAYSSPFLRMIAKRGFSAMASSRPLGQVADIETTTLDNKVVVAAAESVYPVPRVSVVFRAGSRHETYDLQGGAQMLRMSAGLTTQNCSGFAITRNLQQMGSTLTATSDREIVAFTLEITGNQLECGLRYLQDIIQPAFKPWELADIVPQIKAQVSSLSPETLANELLHKAAFRTGLGNSAYIPKHQIGNLSSESLLHYAGQTCTADRCAVVGVGIDFNALCGFAYNLELERSTKKVEKSTYYGGDARKDTRGNIAHVAIAGPGAALVNQKEVLSFAILKYAVGGGGCVKRGNNNGVYGKAVACALGSTPVSLSTFNINHSDAGLFGVLISGDTQITGKAIDVVVKSLKSATVSSADVKRGKALLKNEILETYASDKSLLGVLAIQASINKEVAGGNALVAAIDAITDQDVQEAAKKVASSKLSIGAVGNLSCVPYASDLA